jgi:ribonuclease P protein component
MVGRLVHPLVQSADFERVLGTPSKARSAHFAVHHLAAAPHVKPRPAPRALVPELSTVSAPSGSEVVDNSNPVEPAQPFGLWLGTVVPKRHAKRSVTRNLVKRQMRAAVARHAEALAQGLWVLRLRSPIDRKRFTSAASDALRCAVRDELDAMLRRAAQR